VAVKEINFLNKPGEPFPIAVVVSRFNEECTTALLKGALDRLMALKFPEDQIVVVHVPGAVEIPLAAKQLIATGKYKAIVTLGAVIRGETTPYDYVCNMVSNGCANLSLATGVPVIFGVLTTENDEQAMARSGGAQGNKGADAVDAACEMVQIGQALFAKKGLGIGLA